MRPIPDVRVLIVEDDPDQARLLERKLSWSLMACFTASVAPDLESALLAIEKETYDAVLLDLSLPDSAGLATISSLGSLSRHIPIVVLTANDDDEAALLAARIGVQDYLIKGNLDTRTLSRAVLAAIDRHRWAMRAALVAQAEAGTRRSAPVSPR
jgi:DNA-binding response OmpR family regulator